MKNVADRERSSSTKDEPSVEELQPGEIVSNRFVVESPIGSGGMGRIYLAYQRPFNRPVALKVMHRRALEDQELVERFFQEASTVSHLAHPNTVTVYDFGRTKSGLLFIAMELVDGVSLGDEIRARKRLPADEAIPYTIQIAQSLGEAHHKGLIHRDLKPDNVMLCKPPGSDAFVKVLDFGIAKVLGKEERWTKVGSIVGTPYYMAPEQAKNNTIDGRTDLYSLGCCLYEMLTGAPPFMDESPVKVLLSHQNDPVPALPRGFHPALDRFMARALAKDPADRPADAAAFAAELLATVIEMRSDSPMLGRTTPLDGRASMTPDPLSSTPKSSPRATKPEALVERAAALAGDQDEMQRIQSAPTLDAEASDDGSSYESNFPSNDELRIGTDETLDEAALDRAPKAGHGWIGYLALAIAVVGLAGVAFLVGREFSKRPAAPDSESLRGAASSGSTARVRFESNPKGATVYVDGVAIGTTPIDAERETFEPIDVRFETPGYSDFSMTDVEVSANVANRIFAPMEPKSLSVIVEAPVAGVVVWIESESYGAIPKEIPRTFELPFPTERLEIRLEADGYEPYIDRVDANFLDDTHRVAPDADVFVPTGL